MNIKGQNKQPQTSPTAAASKTAPFAARKSDVDTLKQDDKASYPFGKINFICMGICLVLIIVGFLLMGGEGSSVERGFNPDIFSTRRIVVGPLLAFLGFLFMAFAIIIKPGKCPFGRCRNKNA